MDYTRQPYNYHQYTRNMNSNSVVLNPPKPNTSLMGPTYNNNKMAAPSVTKARQSTDVECDIPDQFGSQLNDK